MVRSIPDGNGVKPYLDIFASESDVLTLNDAIVLGAKTMKAL
jgi:hypothetical protein